MCARYPERAGGGGKEGGVGREGGRDGGEEGEGGEGKGEGGRE